MIYKTNSWLSQTRRIWSKECSVQEINLDHAQSFTWNKEQLVYAYPNPYGHCKLGAVDGCVKLDPTWFKLCSVCLYTPRPPWHSRWAQMDTVADTWDCQVVLDVKYETISENERTHQAKTLSKLMAYILGGRASMNLVCCLESMFYS